MYSCSARLSQWDARLNHLVFHSKCMFHLQTFGFFGETTIVSPRIEYICILLRVKKTWHPSLQVRSTAALWIFPRTVESTEVVRFVGIKHHKGQPSFTVPSDPEPAMIAKAQTKKICPPSRWHPLRGPPLDWDWVSNLRWLRLKIQVTTLPHGDISFFWRSAVDQKVDGFGLLCIFFTQSLVCGQTEQPEDFCP